MVPVRWLLAAGACGLLALPLAAQTPTTLIDGRRAVRVTDSLWTAAVGRQTRSADGAPGRRYWVQSAAYQLRAELDPGARNLRGSGRLRYRNHSPDTLRKIALGLAQNLFRANAPHNELVPLTGGLDLQTLCVASPSRADAPPRCNESPSRGGAAALRIDHTIAWLTLSTPLLPGDSLDLQATWRFAIPPDRAPRMGTDGSVTMVGYWYPQFCVYDDVVGWQVDPYLATGEFYMDHADYDVEIVVPRAYLVGATGTLENPADVLAPEVRERLDKARRSFATIAVVNDSVRRAGVATLEGSTLRWHFRAAAVRDFAFYVSRDVVWDAMAAVVPRRDGGSDTVLVHALYRPRERDWRRAADIGRQSIEQFSRLLWPYPWSQMTLVEGVVNGGMEYPMLTVVSVDGDSRALRSTLAHEIGHMWTPMQVGSDERRFAWMDEGVASWLERSLLQATTGRDDDDAGIPSLYRTLVGMRAEESMLTHADHYRSSLTYTAASYEKLVVVFRAFAAEYGDSALVRGLRSYGAAWSGRHPYPADFVRQVFAAAGADLDAFVRDWVTGTGYFDVRLDGVRRQGDSLRVVVHSAGGAHLSVPLVVTRVNGQREEIRIPASAFRLDPRQLLMIGDARSVTSIVIDPDRLRPDIDRDAQRWTP
jgi:Peptidase family M1 domain